MTASSAETHLTAVLHKLAGPTATPRSDQLDAVTDLAESKYRDQVAERKRALEAEVAAAKSTGGLTPETLDRIERETSFNRERLNEVHALVKQVEQAASSQTKR